MGHSHLHAVLIFYGWTAVASVGCLLTFVFPVYFGIPSGWAFLILGIGFLVCAAFTLAPLGRRKRLTVAAEADDTPPYSPTLDELEARADEPSADREHPVASGDTRTGAP
jgi:UDP-GlcNAc:undecaprenyl-phosphate GlcNAc-1-phosphate transferase